METIHFYYYHDEEQVSETCLMAETRAISDANGSSLRCLGTAAVPPPTIRQTVIYMQVALKTLSLFPFEEATRAIRATDSLNKLHQTRRWGFSSYLSNPISLVMNG